MIDVYIILDQRFAQNLVVFALDTKWTALTFFLRRISDASFLLKVSPFLYGHVYRRSKEAGSVLVF